MQVITTPVSVVRSVASRTASRRSTVCKGAAVADRTIQTYVKDGFIGAVAPFEEGLDVFGFANGVDDSTLKRYREAELTHGRVSMLAAVGFLVGEQVEGSSFLFDAQVTGPAIDHFQQVPGVFWGATVSLIFVCESIRVQKAWANPFESDKLFQLADNYEPGNLEFDPLGFSNGKDEAWLLDMRLKELNNGRLAMISISGMVAQELVNGLNIIPADEVLEMGKSADLVEMEIACAGKIDEAACAKAFEAAERAATFAAGSLS